jgi:Holliday junction resolvasome RuvABC ATP-dependent DNA helicase subunit
MSEQSLSEELRKPEGDLDIRLRPSRFSDFVGQGKIRERLELFEQVCQAIQHAHYCCARVA